MVLKSAFIAAVCVGLLTLAVPAGADEYRPEELLGLDLSKAVLSPKRLGPETHFVPVPVEAESDRGQATADASVWPGLPAHKTRVEKIHLAKDQLEKPHIEKARIDKMRVAKIHVAKTRLAKTRAATAHSNARVNLAHRRSNPLDAQARDTRIQTWPCRSGGICNWQR